MTSRDLIDELLARAQRGRWLESDAQMQLWGDDAQSWVESRVDELVSALHSVGGKDQVPSFVRIEHERSFVRASERWAKAWTDSAKVTHESAQVLRALASASKGITTVGNFETEIDSAIQTAWDRSLACRLAIPGSMRAPIRVFIRRHIQWVEQYGTARVHDSPWWPLWMLWERGCWPLLLPDHGLLLVVPVVKNGKIVVDPERNEGVSFVLRQKLQVRVPESAESVESFATRLGVGPVAGYHPSHPPGWFEIREGADAQVFLIDGMATIGRAGDQSLRLRDNSVAIKHCVVRREGGLNRYEVRVSGGRKSTWVNDEPLSSSRYLQSGDVLRVGRQVLHYDEET